MTESDLGDPSRLFKITFLDSVSFLVLCSLVHCDGAALANPYFVCSVSPGLPGGHSSILLEALVTQENAHAFCFFFFLNSQPRFVLGFVLIFALLNFYFTLKFTCFKSQTSL